MISTRLKDLRLQNGIKTKKEASQMLEMPYTTYNNYETGTREPGSNELIKFANFYNVTIDYILGLVELSQQHFSANMIDENADTDICLNNLTSKSIKIAQLYDMASDDDKCIVELTLRKYEEVKKLDTEQSKEQTVG